MRFAIVGSGNIAATYVKALKNICEAELAAIVSRSGKRPDGVPESIEVASTLDSVKSYFDAAIIATPHGLHHIGAMTAARLGKHVLCEKPLGISIPAMDTAIRECDAHKVKLAVAYQRRTAPDNMIVKELLEQGTLGRIFACELQVKFYRDQAYYESAPYRGNKALDGGGVFIQQASHNIDLYGWFFGRPEKTVSMLGTFAHRIEGEDYGVALMKHHNGMIGSITASTATKPGFPGRMMIHSERGYLTLENDIIAEWQIAELKNPSVSQSLKLHSGSANAKVENTSGHEAIISDFMEAVEHNREPLISGNDARLATEIIIDIYSGNVA
ncbi:MAG: Gfo/Idh/MocA family oxidoreductase [Victivallaceae bacterium]|nr:Gfo/Idh/MocA family oxidoreductase [Victivallaceae bacterium]